MVTSFLPYYEKTGDWQALAGWIHDNIPWHQNLEKRIDNYGAARGCLTKEGMENHKTNHVKFMNLFYNQSKHNIIISEKYTS